MNKQNEIAELEKQMKIVLLHGYGQFDGYCRAEIFSNENQLKHYIANTDTCPTIAFKIPEENIIADYSELMEYRRAKTNEQQRTD